MTKAKAREMVKTWGLTFKYDAIWQEYVINYPMQDSRRTKDSDYHTYDIVDAVETAWKMAGYLKGVSNG